MPGRPKPVSSIRRSLGNSCRCSCGSTRRGRCWTLVRRWHGCWGAMRSAPGSTIAFRAAPAASARARGAGARRHGHWRNELRSWRTAASPRSSGTSGGGVARRVGGAWAWRRGWSVAQSHLRHPHERGGARIWPDGGGFRRLRIWRSSCCISARPSKACWANSER